MFKNFSSGLFTSTSLPTVIAWYRLNGDILLSFCYHKMTKTWIPRPPSPLVYTCSILVPSRLLPPLPSLYLQTFKTLYKPLTHPLQKL